MKPLELMGIGPCWPPMALGMDHSLTRGLGKAWYSLLHVDSNPCNY